ncbi:MAG: DUF1318 domain-containing protein [Proteobacteria bacterium]|nr:DUF1318 domain-containing protein [Pseudomonadota bacterium]
MTKVLISIAIVTFSTFGFSDINSMRARLPKIVELKDKGFIGEQPDGFLGVVEDKEGAASVVAEENADRKEVYSERAKTQGQPLEVFGAVIGGAKTRDEQAGRFIRNSSGKWTKK